MVSFWFKGKELAFALGIAVTFPELGNALNSWLTPIINESTGSLGTPFMVSVFICLISLGCALMAAYLDKQADDVRVQLLRRTRPTTCGWWSWSARRGRSRARR